ncbi:hypothetical protein KBZ14_02530 [Synechococcus sp. HJ21-Hayes]|uniref:hypothetical protein n=1 Tax=unclassified Synechococcus TaxID=2626047 RepID=UPI0020CF5BE1|nr:MULTISPECIES: hypothetical protein [unclassified Synechococcus]MCP9831652.1 hypothetical protein [Synechococcus sp. JJ3a-Johnson]MCP9851746.1 hypothetical protein [Synechococcus sp. HJ21-Hayes]
MRWRSHSTGWLMGLLVFPVPGLNTLLQPWLATLNGTLQERRYHEHAERHHKQRHQHQ